MKKTIVSILIIAGVALAVFLGVYFTKQNKPAVDSVKNTAQENPSSQINTEQMQNKMVTDDFEIVVPDGWKQTAPAMGSSAMAVKINENLNDPAAQKINFQSYFAVSYDTLQDKNMSEYVQIVKNGLQQTIPGAIFTKDQDMTINGKSAHAIEAELTQQGVNFKILMIAITGEEKDVWVMSFNTTKNSWDIYKETFYSIANSFSLKK